MNLRLRNLLKNIGAFGFGLVLVSLFLGSVEFFFRLNETHHWLKERTVDFPTRKDPYQFDTSKLEYLKNLEPYSGVQDFDDPDDYHHAFDFSHCVAKALKLDPYWIGIPNCRARVTLKKAHSHRTVYDTYYSFESHGLRVIPAAKSNSENFLLFLGCSFTWGEGVSDENTFANQITKGFSGFNGFNLGMGGYGPNSNLAVLENGKLDIRMQAIKGNNGIAVYTYIDDQLRRLLGSASWIGNSDSLTDPYFTLRNQRLTRNGSFQSGRPFRTFIYSQLSKLALLRYLKLDPPGIDEADIEFFVSVIKEMQSILVSQYHVKRFIFSAFSNPSLYMERLKPKLEREGIEVFDFSTFPAYEITKGRNLNFGNGHPTALGYKLYSDLFLFEAARRKTY